MNHHARSPFAPDDTSHVAREAQFEIYRKMGAGGRFQAGLDLCDEVRTGLAKTVRARHPEYDDETVRLATVRLLLGEELFREVFRGIEVLP